MLKARGDPPQKVDDGRVGQIAEANAHVEGGEAEDVHDVAGHDGPEGVGERVGDVGDGVDAAVHGRVAHVDEVAERGQDGRVDERDAEADARDGYHDGQVVGAEGDDEAGDALERQPARRQHPLVLRKALGHPDGEPDAGDVRYEAGQPHEAHLRLRRLHRLLHVDGDGGLEEGERHVGHDERARAHRDVRVHEEAPDGRALGLVRLVLLEGHGDAVRPHDQHEHEAVEEGEQREEDEGQPLADVLVEEAAEGRRGQAAERDEGERDAQRLRAFAFCTNFK